MFQKRQQNREAPDMIVARFSICDDNTTDGAESENNIASTNPSFISFVDRGNIPQEYELDKHLL